MTASSRPTPCPVCKDVRSRPFHADQAVRLVRCARCGLKYQSPPPSIEALQALYSSQEYYDGQYLPAHRAERRAMFAHRLREMEALRGGPGDVLEIGCGTGQFLEAARERGWRVSGQEFARETVEALAGKFPDARLAWGVFPGECPFPEASFDLVHLNHVIEHFFDPLAALRRVHGLLRPGGLLYCEAPRLSGVQKALCGLVGGKDFRLSCFLEHIAYFDKPSMDLALRSTGFTPLSLRIEGMGDPHRFVRGVHYHSPWTHLIALLVGTFRLQGPLGGGNLVAVARKEDTP